MTLCTCENPVGLSICDSPIETALIRRWVPFERRGWLGWGCILVAKVSVAIATIAEFLEPPLWVVLMYA